MLFINSSDIFINIVLYTYKTWKQISIYLILMQLQTMRGCILEDAIPCSSRLSSARGPHHKDVLEYLLPDLPLSSLHHAPSTPDVSQLILKLDEQKV